MATSSDDRIDALITDLQKLLGRGGIDSTLHPRVVPTLAEIGVALSPGPRDPDDDQFYRHVVVWTLNQAAARLGADVLTGGVTVEGVERLFGLRHEPPLTGVQERFADAARHLGKDDYDGVRKAQRDGKRLTDFLIQHLAREIAAMAAAGQVTVTGRFRKPISPPAPGDDDPSNGEEDTEPGHPDNNGSALARGPEGETADHVTSATGRSRRHRLFGVGIACVLLLVGVALATVMLDREANRGTAATTPTTVTTTEKPAPERSQAEIRAEQRRRRQAREQRSLKHFARVTLEQPVNCSPIDRLPRSAVAQQACRLNGARLVFTRLKSQSASRRFWRQRFLNSYPFTGSNGANCGDGPWGPSSTWVDGQGTTQGLFAFRTSGNDAVLIWEIRSHRVVIRASQSHRHADNLCQIWYSRFGEVLPR